MIGQLRLETESLAKRINEILNAREGSDASRKAPQKK